jgi:pseudaminic acid biosynthesis-associated methylase
MSLATDQLAAWTSEFGRSYTDRNTMTVEAMDRAFQLQLGVRKSDLYRELVGPAVLPGGRVLEVGCNIGLQLRLLQVANPTLELHGVEPQRYALDRARELSPSLTFHQGTAFALPFSDACFDLVMTHGVLIHIDPRHLDRALREIHRVAGRLILCHEYFAPAPTEVRYRGQGGLLWKTDFARCYRERFPDLRERSVRHYPYSEAFGGAELVDQVALFEKARAR